MPQRQRAVYLLDREKIREFALAIGDQHPLHLDLEAARRAGYRDLVAPPMMASVYAGRPFRALLWSRAMEVDRTMTVHGSQEFRWPSLAVAGDELTTVAELRKDERRRANRFIEIETSSVTQDGILATSGVWTVIVRPSQTATQDPDEAISRPQQASSDRPRR
jgi:acyl dehydratase